MGGDIPESISTRIRKKKSISGEIAVDFKETIEKCATRETKNR